MRLLLAEDEKALSSALQVILKHNNYSVDAVYNGQDAYDYIMAGVYIKAVRNQGYTLEYKEEDRT